MGRRTTAIFVTLAFSAVLSVGPGWLRPADADSNPPTPGVQPVSPGPNGYFEAALAPGQQRSFAVIIKNLGATPADYIVYPADGTTSQVTGVQYSEPTPPPTGAGSWIKLSATRLTLPAGGQQQVTFVVSVPAGTSPGDHVGAIVAAGVATGNPTSTTTTPSSGVALAITSRVVVAVVVHVPGPAAVALAVGTPSFGMESGGRQTLNIPLDDTGALLFKPRIQGSVVPCGTGSPILTFDRQLDTFVPHTAIVYAYHIDPERLPEGCYGVHVTASGNGQQLGSFQGLVQLGAVAAGTATTLNRGGFGQLGPRTSRKGLTSAAIGLGAAAGSLALLVLVVLLVLVWRRRRREDESPDQPAPVTSGSVSRG